MRAYIRPIHSILTCLTIALISMLAPEVHVSSAQTLTFSRSALELIGSQPGYTLAVAVSGDFAYMGDAGALQVVDISDKAAPKALGKVALPGINGSIEGATVVGNLVYATGNPGMWIVDVSNPSNPTVRGRYTDKGFLYGTVYVAGNYAYLMNKYAGLVILDVSDPAHPSFYGQYLNGFAYDGKLVGNLVYIAAGNDGLFIIDVSNPAYPSLRAHLATVKGYGIDVVGNFVYIANDVLYVVDVSNSAAPTTVSTLPTPALYQLRVSNGFIFGAAEHNGVGVWDIRHTPTRPRLLGYQETTDSALFLQVVNSYAYIADGNAGLLISRFHPEVLQTTQFLPVVRR